MARPAPPYPRVERAASPTAQLLEQLVEANPDAMIVVDADGLVVLANRQVETLFGYLREELLGRPVEQLVPEARRGVHQAARSRYAKAPTHRPMGAGLELRARRRDGSEFPVEVSLAPLQVEDRRSTAAVIRDASERQAARAELEWRALHDPMTGLANRALLMEELRTAIARSSRTGKRVAVFFLDLDRLKWVNDSLGHEAGDRLLMAVAQRLAEAVRPQDTVARIGGDEFVAIVEDVEDPEVLAGRVLRTIGQRLDLAGREVIPEVSIGIAMAQAGNADPSVLLRDADTAMYRAKRRGRGRFEVFQHAWRQAAAPDLDLLVALQRDLDDDAVDVHYQPVVQLATGTTRGVEALVRWRGPGGLVDAQRVLGLAEQGRLVLCLDEAVITRACRELAQLSPAGPLQLGVNVSARHLATGDLPAVIGPALAASGLSPDRLWLELTESERLVESGALAALEDLAGMGVGIAIDDFGSGLSTLAGLRDLPATLLKVDRGFLAGVPHDPRSTDLLAALVELGHALGLDVLAEGVETPEQAASLVQMGCELGQGFLWAPALPVGALQSWLAASTDPVLEDHP
jgi:diguanylate cyclase (GGDEF)-like protein/PAS domain S-box-containing protein